MDKNQYFECLNEAARSETTAIFEIYFQKAAVSKSAEEHEKILQEMKTGIEKISSSRRIAKTFIEEHVNGD